MFLRKVHVLIFSKQTKFIGFSLQISDKRTKNWNSASKIRLIENILKFSQTKQRHSNY